jgi:membrane associated rhomboid family serine protease
MDMDDVRAQAVKGTPVTYAILGICILLFLVGYLGGRERQLQEAFAQSNLLIDQGGGWWRLVTSMFLHDGFAHVAFNMYALYMFGPPLEREVGSAPFGVMYLASGVVGGVFYYFMGDLFGVAVGASGAIFGLFGAWLVASYRGRHTAHGAASLRQLLTLLAINAFIGFVPGFNIAWEAHLGGLVAGAVIALAWALPTMQKRPAARTAAALAVGLVALAAVLVV